jgi:hypothetical protein
MLDIYTALRKYCEFLNQYTETKEFNGKSYKSINSDHSKELREYINSVMIDRTPTNSDVSETQPTIIRNADHLSIQNFHSTFCHLITLFDKEILAKDERFFVKEGIQIIFRILHYALANVRFNIISRVRNQIAGIQQFNREQLEYLNSVYNQMLNVFKNNNKNEYIIARNEPQESAESDVDDDDDDHNENATDKNDRFFQLLYQNSQQLSILTSLLTNNMSQSQSINSNLNQINKTKSSNLSNNCNITTNNNNNNISPSYSGLEAAHITNLKNLIRKKIYKEQHLSSIKSLVAINQQNNNGRTLTPNSLVYHRFPQPMLHDNAIFVNEYNQLINNFQNETMKLIIKHLNKELDEIDKAINSFKTNMIHLNNNISAIVTAIDYEVRQQENNEIIRRDNKNKNILKYDKATKYDVKQYNHSDKYDNSNRINVTSNNYQLRSNSKINNNKRSLQNHPQNSSNNYKHQSNSQKRGQSKQYNQSNQRNQPSQQNQSNHPYNRVRSNSRSRRPTSILRHNSTTHSGSYSQNNQHARRSSSNNFGRRGQTDRQSRNRSRVGFD